jgi:hypothetical protein
VDDDRTLHANSEAFLPAIGASHQLSGPGVDGNPLRSSERRREVAVQPEETGWRTLAA